MALRGYQIQVAPVFNIYAEATSLNLLYFYGLGPNSPQAGQSAFGLTETLAGALNRAWRVDVPTRA